MSLNVRSKRVWLKRLICDSIEIIELSGGLDGKS